MGIPMVNYETRVKLFAANNKSRQAAVHRYHWGLSIKDFEYAMVLPIDLADNRHASEIE